MRFFIDPGHGGSDSGAVSFAPLAGMGVKEKVLNLNISLMLTALLKGKGHEVLMARDTDIFVPLADRAVQANAYKPDVVLSVHCNSRLQSGKFGLEVETYHNPGSLRGERVSFFLLEALKAEWQLEGDPKVPFISRGVKEAHFYILSHTNAPASLVELGFLTDPEEVSILTNPKYQELFAKALAVGLLA